MGSKLIKSAVMFCGLLSGVCFSEETTWIGANDAGHASFSWDLKGDYFRVNVLVNGQAPFTCADMVVWESAAISLGEDGQCDIRSSFFDGEISILVEAYLDSEKKPVDNLEATLFKDTVYPSIEVDQGMLNVTDLNLDPNATSCLNESTNSFGCPKGPLTKGTWIITATDLAKNVSKSTITIP